MAKAKRRSERHDPAVDQPAGTSRMALVPMIGTGLTAAAALAGVAGRILAARREVSARRSRAAIVAPAAGVLVAALAAVAAWRSRRTRPAPA